MIYLKTILEEHAKWLQDPSTGKKANLSGVTLNGAKLNFKEELMLDIKTRV